MHTMWMKVFLMTVAVSMLILAACGNKTVSGESSGKGTEYEGDEGGVPVEMSKVVHFLFEDHSGRYGAFEKSYALDVEAEDIVVKIRLDGADEEDALVFASDEEFLDCLEKIVTENHVEGWNGFSLNAKDVKDGDSFYLTIRMDNGQTISARGYEAWPEGYKKALGELDALFGELIGEQSASES
ncbi:MAG: hypothetical protein K5770_00010 [Lachnospiraceae bacterium]|nr:hypothetical protein [Lachnospiraceae bacterium]